VQVAVLVVVIHPLATLLEAMAVAVLFLGVMTQAAPLVLQILAAAVEAVLIMSATVALVVLVLLYSGYLQNIIVVLKLVE